MIATTKACLLYTSRYAIAPMRSNPPMLASQFLRSLVTRVCVAIVGNSPAEMIEKATAVVKETPFLEFRLDYLDKPLLALPKLRQFFTDNTAANAIATCRRAANGGRFSGTLSAEAEILSKAAETGFRLVDLELESAESLKKPGVQKLRDTGIGLIISHHDFAATKDLDGIFQRIERFTPCLLYTSQTQSSPESLSAAKASQARRNPPRASPVPVPDGSSGDK